MSVIADEQFVRLVDYGDQICIEDKYLYGKYPTWRGETKTFIKLSMEFAILPDGSERLVRVCYPKKGYESTPGAWMRLIYNQFYQIEREREKEFGELTKLQQIYGAQTPVAQMQQPEEKKEMNAEDAKKLIEQYLKELGL